VSADPSSPEQPRHVRLLIVEDSDDDARLVVRVLRRSGFEPAYERVQDVHALRSALRDRTWDAVLSDFRMPQFSGVDALRAFRTMDIDIPFIFVSGTIGEEVAVEAMRAGASDYVMKQNLARLGPALERELSQAAVRAERRQAQVELEQARRQAEAHLRAQLERLQLLDHITTAIGERQDLKSIYQVAIGSLEAQLPADFACMCRYSPMDKALTVLCVAPHSLARAMAMGLNEQTQFAIDENGLSHCVAGELVHEADIGASAAWLSRRLAEAGIRSLVAVPLSSEQRVLGLLLVAREQVDAFSSGECEFLRQLSAHVALAAQQAELRESLQLAYDDLRRTQEAVMQQERLRALGQMASGIAHDINNAISPVSLYAEHLLDSETGLTARGRAALETVARAIDDVAATVSRMREFYRQRELPGTMRPMRLNDLVQQVIELTQARWRDMPQQRGAVVRLETALAEDLPEVPGVESEVREALINLLFNAVDAMPDGGVLTLCTRTAAAAPDDGGAGGHRVMVEVQDTGTGMDESTRRRCLEPFFTTKGERGTGLGLAMVYGTAQRHGATVEIDSELGRGTCMRLAFPLSHGPSQPQALDDTAALRPLASLRILLVDDDPLIIRSLSDTLAHDGHDVSAASGGQAGIDAFAQALAEGRGFDLVITDLGMPYVDGRRVAAAVKALHAATPVLLLTGWGRRMVTDGEVPPHVDMVLSKPPKMRELLAALAQLTGTSGMDP
jgi:signal transduction histidine kinase/DNA-binding response OmpR family regulator